MRDDDMMDGMDGLLRATMSESAPTPSPTFEQDVMRRTAPRRVTRAGRIALYTYALASVVLCVWLMRDLPLAMSAVALVVNVVAAVALRGYTSSLAHSR